MSMFQKSYMYAHKFFRPISCHTDIYAEAYARFHKGVAESSSRPKFDKRNRSRGVWGIQDIFFKGKGHEPIIFNISLISYF